MGQPGQVSITITEEKTKELIEAYSKFLGVKPASVIALAMRKALPDMEV